MWEEVNRLDGEDDPGLDEELELIQIHVEARRKESRTITKELTNVPIVERLLQLRQESTDFGDGPKGLDYFDKSQVGRLRASYAYRYDHELRKAEASADGSQ